MMTLIKYVGIAIALLFAWPIILFGSLLFRIVEYNDEIFGIAQFGFAILGLIFGLGWFMMVLLAILQFIVCSVLNIPCVGNFVG